MRVILDSQLRIPLDARVLNLTSSASTLLVTTTCVQAEKMREVQAKGAEVLTFDGTRPALRSVLEHLAGRGVLSVLVEGGGMVHAAMLEERLADKVVAFVAPKLLGGREAPTPVEGRGVESMVQAVTLHRLTVRQLGEDVVLEGYLQYPARVEVGAGASGA